MTKRIKEYRDLVEIRAEQNEDGVMRLTGYAAVFDSLSLPIYGRFREIIRRGAFTKTLKEQDQWAFYEHNSRQKLARVKNGSLMLQEDERGLRVDLLLPNTTIGRDAFEEVRTGLTDSMSFGFSAITDDFSNRSNDGYPIRDISEARLYEVSITSDPAYLDARVDVRSIAEQVLGAHGLTLRDAEDNDATTDGPEQSAPPDAGAERRKRLALAKARLTLNAN